MEAMGERYMMSIPPVYTSPVLEHTLIPRTLWEQLGGVIINDRCDNKYQELMNWMRYALTAQANTTTTATALPTALLEVPTNCPTSSLSQSISPGP